MFKKNAAWFLIKFFVIFFALYSLLFAAPTAPLENGIAGFEAKLLGIEARENALLFDSSALVVTESCTGMLSAITLAAVVFSLKKPCLKKKVTLFAAGAIALLSVNLLRVYAVVAIAMRGNIQNAETMHVLSWFAMAALILLLWFYLTKKVAKVENFRELI